MIVEPFKRPPAPPRIALVNDEGIYVDEQGNEFLPSNGYKFRRGELVCYILWDTAISLTQQGIGEFLRWNTKDIRWRATRYPDEDSWKPRPLDAGILQFPVRVNIDFYDILSQLVEFRDWLVSEGAKPYCSFGSTSIGLLRAKLENKLVTGMGAAPPINFTRGGRMAMGLNGKGAYSGHITNWDLPSAYASTLGNIPYNGSWQVRPYSAALKAYEHGAPVYCHATVDIDNLNFGPLPSNISRPANPIEGAILNKFGYPRNGRIEGIWTLNELFAAEDVGCKIAPILCWVMLTGKQPFLPWWQSILRGRSLSGPISKSLAKRTGNALWGMFCTDSHQKTKKVIVHYENGKAKIRRLDFRRNGQNPGHDLAEAVSSGVRAKLYQHMVAADSHLLCAHTDGVWVQGNYEIPNGWRVKMEARKIELLDPQTLRYYVNDRKSYVVMAGVPPRLAPDKFENRWQRVEHNLPRKDYLPTVRKDRGNKRGVSRVSSPDDF